MKYSQQGLRASFQCYECIGIIEKERVNADPDIYTESFAQEAQRLLSILNGRIQTFLKEIVKILKNSPTPKKKANAENESNLFDDYKEMFALSLRLNDKSPRFSAEFHDAMTQQKRLYEKHNNE